jgi:HSP20 family molecular chaperone IbpA
LTAWDAVSTLDRLFDDVMGSTFGTATNRQAFDPSIDVRANENEMIFICDVPGARADEAARRGARREGGGAEHAR